MARRYHEIKGLAEFTAKTIVSDEKQWKKFLHTRGIKYRRVAAFLAWLPVFFTCGL